MQIDIERLRDFVRERDAAAAANHSAATLVRHRRQEAHEAQTEADRFAHSYGNVDFNPGGDRHSTAKTPSQTYDARLSELRKRAADAHQRSAVARDEVARTQSTFSHASGLCARALAYARSLPNVNLPADLRDDL